MKPYKVPEETPAILSEPAVVYQARIGQKPSIFTNLLVLTGFTKEELASYFNTSSKTIHRYLSSGKALDPFVAEHALSMKSLYHQGIELFDSLPLFRQWLSKPNFGLGNMIPQDLLKTPGGLRLVKEELLRIEYGATA